MKIQSRNTWKPNKKKKWFPKEGELILISKGHNATKVSEVEFIQIKKHFK